MKSILNSKRISLSLVLLMLIVSLTSSNTLGNTAADVQQIVSGPPDLSLSPVMERSARSFCSNPFSRGEEKDSDTNPSVKGSERANCTLNSWTDRLSTLKRDQEPLVAGEPILKFDLGDYFQLSFGYPTPLLLRFTYTSYIDPTHVNVTLESADSPEWISVNTQTRLVEDGMWTDIYYPYHIETDIDVGDTINWFMGTGYVDGTAWYDWNGTSLEAWILLLDDYSPDSYAYFHKETGIMLYYWDSLHDMEVFIADTNMVTLAPTVTITYPNGGERLSGTVNIYWTASVVKPVGDYLTFTVYYWDDSSWVELVSDLGMYMYAWDTTTVTDGAFYKIRVVARDVELTGEDESDATFIINNINEPPNVMVTHPNGGETFHDDFVTINWTASDPDGDYLSFTIYYWNGSSWVERISGWHGTYIVWYIGKVPGGSFYKIRVIASDGMYTAEDESNAAFTIDNPLPLIVRITHPNDGRRLSGTVNIHWTMSRSTGDPLTFTVYYWDGSSWVELASGLTTTSYEWNTTTVPDGSGYKIRVVVNDGTFTAEDETDNPFTIDNAVSTSTTPTTIPIPGFEAILALLIFLSLGLAVLLRSRKRSHAK